MYDIYTTPIKPGVYEECQWGADQDSPKCGTITVVEVKGGMLVVSPEHGCILYCPGMHCALADALRLLFDPEKPWVHMGGSEAEPKLLWNLATGQN